MATKNSKQPKAERAKALIQQQQRRERRRRAWIIGGVVLAVVVIVVAGIYAQANRDKTGQAAAEVPGNLTSQFSVTVGKSSAPTTITLYEDLQCPVCRDFEAVTGDPVRAAIDAGKVKVDYHLVAFLDRASTTNYSSRALNAAMTVLDTTGPDAFLKYHTLLFDNQPPEGSAGLTDQQLIDYAVKAGATRSAVTQPIKDDRYHQWVLNATNQMSLDHVTGTPTVYIDGKSQGNDPTAAARAVLAAIK